MPRDGSDDDGRGLAIVAALADKLGHDIRAGGQTVWAEGTGRSSPRGGRFRLTRYRPPGTISLTAGVGVSGLYVGQLGVPHPAACSAVRVLAR